MSNDKEKIFPDGWFHDAANQFVFAMEAQVLEQLMNQMYEAGAQAEKCGCAQCQKRGDATRVRFWTEHHRARSAPEMDHEEEELMNFALMRLEQIQQGRKKKKSE